MSRLGCTRPFPTPWCHIRHTFAPLSARMSFANLHDAPLIERSSALQKG